MTEKVNPSPNRPAEAFKTALSISYGGHGAGPISGYVVPGGDPTDIAAQDTGITEGNLNAFSQSSSASSLDVTIDAGEAFVAGSWLAIDSSTTVSLAASTNGQTVYVGWDKQAANDVIVGLDAAFDTVSDNTDERIPLYDFDTDGSGVTSVTDRRRTDYTIDVPGAAYFGSNEDAKLEWTGSALDINSDLDLENAVIDNSELVNDSVTINAGTGLTSGGSVSLGGTSTLFDVDESASFTWTSEHTFNGGITAGSNIDLQSSNRVINAPSPSDADDLARKAYVDSVAQGLNLKESTRASSTGNIDLTSTTDPNPVDGVTLNDGDRILLKDQTDGTENGIYVATTATDPSTWTRSADADEDSEVTSGMFTFVEEGTSNGNTSWIVTTNDPITLGSTAISFAQFASAGEISAGDGLTKSGLTLNIEPADFAGAHLSDDGSNDLAVDDDFVENTGDTITGTLTANGSPAIDVSGDIDDGAQTIWDTSAQEIPDSAMGSIANSTLANDTITINGGTDISGGSASLGGTVTVDHADTSTQGNVTTNGATIIDDVDIDGRGHVTNVNTENRTIDDWSNSGDASNNNVDADMVDGEHASDLGKKKTISANLPSHNLNNGEYVSLARFTVPSGRTMKIYVSGSSNSSHNSPGGFGLVVRNNTEGQTEYTDGTTYSDGNPITEITNVAGDNITVAVDNGQWLSGSGTNQVANGIFKCILE